MISKKQALYLLEDAFKTDGLTMTHGTSVESTITLLQTGNLPSSFERNGNHPCNKGYLFFVPRKRSFVDHPLFDDIEIDLDTLELESRVESYADNVQGRRFLMDTLGYWPPKHSCDTFEPYGNLSLEVLKSDGVDTESMIRYGLKQLYKDVTARKGVCIGINRNIFEFYIENGCDDPGDEVMIYLPEGLNIKYVHHIFPLGELEEQTLRTVIDYLPEKT